MTASPPATGARAARPGAPTTPRGRALYRAQFALRSPLATPLASATLWGHVCWGIRWHEGNAALERWLERYDAGELPLALSDPLPCGFVPVPALPLPALGVATHPPQLAPDGGLAPATFAALDERKRARKRQWLSLGAWKAIAGGLTASALEEALLGDRAVPPALVEGTLTRGAINRLTMSTWQGERGALFTTAVQAPPRQGITYDLWCASDDGIDAVRRWLEQAVAGGYGRDASQGFGALQLLSVSSSPLAVPAGANAVLLLGSAVPAAADPTAACVRLAVHAGRLGGDFAIGATPDGAVMRQKRPVFTLARGSVLHAGGSPPVAVGRLVRGVHPWPAIRHGGRTVALPLRLAEPPMPSAEG